MKGVKYDGEKLRWSLLPWVQLATVVAVLEYGARKYAFENWKRVERARVRYFDAAMRHLLAWHGGERLDAESGLSHLAHATCCLLFLAWFDDQATAPSSPAEPPQTPGAPETSGEAPAAHGDALRRHVFVPRAPVTHHAPPAAGPPPRGFEYLDPPPRGAESLAPPVSVLEGETIFASGASVLRQEDVGAAVEEPAAGVGGDAQGAKVRDREEVQRLIELGKSKGHLTYGEIVDALPADPLSTEQIDELVGIFGDEGVEIFDAPIGAKVIRERGAEEPAAVEPPAATEEPAGPPPVRCPRFRPTPVGLLDSFPRDMADGETEEEIRRWVSPYLPDWKAALECCDRPEFLFWIGSRLLVCGALRREDFVLASCACASTALDRVSVGDSRPRLAVEAARRWACGEVDQRVVDDAFVALRSFSSEVTSNRMRWLCWACADASVGCDSMFGSDTGINPASVALLVAGVLKECGVTDAKERVLEAVKREFVPALVAAVDAYLSATYEGVPDA